MCPFPTLSVHTPVFFISFNSCCAVSPYPDIEEESGADKTQTEQITQDKGMIHSASVIYMKMRGSEGAFRYLSLTLRRVQERCIITPRLIQFAVLLRVLCVLSVERGLDVMLPDKKSSQPRGLV